MRKSHSILFGVLLTLIASVALAHSDAPAGVVNINSAEASELALLPGIGPATAAKIIAWREENGPFKKATDLMQVKGIGDNTFERLSKHVVLEGKTTLSSDVPSPRAASNAPDKAQQQ